MKKEKSQKKLESVLINFQEIWRMNKTENLEKTEQFE